MSWFTLYAAYEQRKKQVASVREGKKPGDCSTGRWRAMKLWWEIEKKNLKPDESEDD